MKRNYRFAFNKLKALGVPVYERDDMDGRFQISAVKIDQSFVAELPTSADDQAIVRAVVEMGHSLRLRVIAEGVETAEQLATLRSMGCDEYQGYYGGRPVPATEFETCFLVPRTGN